MTGGGATAGPRRIPVRTGQGSRRGLLIGAAAFLASGLPLPAAASGPQTGTRRPRRIAPRERPFPPADPTAVAMVLETESGARTEIRVGEVKAKQTLDVNGRPAVEFAFAPGATAEFARITTDNVGYTVNIIICGRVVLAPKVAAPIHSGTGLISNLHTVAEARELVRAIEHGICITDPQGD